MQIKPLGHLTKCSWILFLVTFSMIRAQDLDWAVSYGTDTLNVYEVLPDSFGNIYSLGIYRGTGDFDPGPGIHNLTSVTSGAPDVYILKTDSAGNFLWAASMGGPGNDIAYGYAVDAAGNVVVAGNFAVTMDADPGPGVVTLSATSQGTFIVKIDPSGNLIWAKQYNKGLDIEGVEIGAGGSIIMVGIFSSSVDLDPGPGISSFTATHPYDSFVLQLNSAGLFEWAQMYSSNALLNSGSLDLDSDGNILFTGQYGGSVDFDPGPAVHSLTGVGSFNGFICKCDPTGAILWVKGFPGYVINWDVAVTSENAVLVTGHFDDSVDFDPGPGTHMVFETVASPENPFLLKLDAGGNFKWVYTPSGLCQPRSVTLDFAGNIFMGGFFADTTDFDPGPGFLNLITPLGSGTRNGFVVKMDSAGQVIWAGQIESTGFNWVRSLATDSDGDLLAGGYFSESADFDPSPGTTILSAPPGEQRAYLSKWQKDCNIRIDIDSLRNMDCSGGPGYASAHVSGTYPPFSMFWGTTPASVDSFAILPSDSIYPLLVTDSLGCVKSTSIRADEAVSYAGFDLEPYEIGGRFTPGLTTTITLCATNNGCLPTSGSLQIVLDPLVHFVSSTVPPSTVSGDTITWITPSLQFDLPPYCVGLQIQTDTAATLGDSIALEVTLSPIAGDIDTTNNMKRYTFTVQAPFDPNHKTVFPAGECDAHFVKTGTQLEYAVTFQNLGSAEAVNVWIQDSLDISLDPSTLSVKASSHALSWEILPGNVMQINFLGIHLPDSASDPAGSTGFVLFKCDHFTGLPDFTMVENQAHIIFDYNDPIATNTVQSLLVDTIPQFLFHADADVCSGSDFLYPDGSLELNVTAPVSHISLLGSIFGCDSTIVTTLHPIAHDTLWADVDLCSGSDYLFPDGSWAINVTTTTVQVSVLSSLYGCDSSIVTTLHPISSDTTVAMLADSALIANGAATSYQWVDCSTGYTIIPGATSPIYMPPVNGSYAVILTQAGCADTSACYPFVLTASSPATVSTGISVYPNPASGTVSISLGRPSSQIQIVDAKGQILKEFDTKGIEKLEVDLSQFSRGIYFVFATGESWMNGVRLMVN